MRLDRRGFLRIGYGYIQLLQRLAALAVPVLGVRNQLNRDTRRSL
ncbi:MAG: hypothetical protein ACI9TF_000713 [Paracrocinitomix sp.]|jgi:hypothetical protein